MANQIHLFSDTHIYDASNKLYIVVIYFVTKWVMIEHKRNVEVELVSEEEDYPEMALKEEQKSYKYALNYFMNASNYPQPFDDTMDIVHRMILSAGSSDDDSNFMTVGKLVKHIIDKANFVTLEDGVKLIYMMRRTLQGRVSTRLDVLRHGNLRAADVRMRTKAVAYLATCSYLSGTDYKPKAFGNSEEWHIESTLWSKMLEKFQVSTQADNRPHELVDIHKKLQALTKAFSSDSFDADLDLEEVFRNLLTLFTKDLDEDMAVYSEVIGGTAILDRYIEG